MSICLKKDMFEKLLYMSLQNCGSVKGNKSYNKINYTISVNPVPEPYLSGKIDGWWKVYYLYVIPFENVNLQINSIDSGKQYTIDMVKGNSADENCVNFVQGKGGFLFGTKGFLGNTVDVTLVATNKSTNISEYVRIVYYNGGSFLQGTTVDSTFPGQSKQICGGGSGGGGCYITSASAGVALVDTTHS